MFELEALIEKRIVATAEFIWPNYCKKPGEDEHPIMKAFREAKNDMAHS